MISGGCGGVLIHWLSPTLRSRPGAGNGGCGAARRNPAIQVMRLARLINFQRGNVVANR